MKPISDNPAASSYAPSADADRAASPGCRQRISQLLKSGHGQNLLGIIDQGIVSGTSFAVSLSIGRLSGAQDLGTLALAVSIVVLVTALHDALISIPFTIFRPQIARELRSAHAGNSLIQVFVLGALASIACLLVSLIGITWFPERSLGTLSMLVAVAIPPVLLRQFVRRYLFASGAILRAVVIDGAVSVIQLGALGVLAALQLLSAPFALSLWSAASCLVSVICLILWRHEFHPSALTFVADMRRHWQRGRWLVGSEMLSVTCGYTTIWILALTMNRAAVGVFAACCVIGQLANPFLLGVGNVLEGRAARAFAAGGPSALRMVIASAFRMFTIVIGIVTILAMLAGARFVEVLYGAEYAHQETIVSLMAFSLLATACGVAASCGLRVIGRADLTFAACALDLAILITVALVLARDFGVTAVALAVLAGSTAGTLFRITAFIRICAIQQQTENTPAVQDAVRWENN